MDIVYISFIIFLIATIYQYLKPKDQRKYISLTVEEAYDRIRTGEDMIIVDVRTRDEYREGHLMNSRSIPMEDFKKHMNRIPRDKPVLLYCQDGATSIRAIRYLEVAGYEDLLHMHEGFRGWSEAGYPIV